MKKSKKKKKTTLVKDNNNNQFAKTLNHLNKELFWDLYTYLSRTNNDLALRQQLTKANLDLNPDTSNYVELRTVLDPYLSQIPFLMERLTLDYYGFTQHPFISRVTECSSFSFTYLDLANLLAFLLGEIEGIPFEVSFCTLITPPGNAQQNLFTIYAPSNEDWQQKIVFYLDVLQYQVGRLISDIVVYPEPSNPRYEIKWSFDFSPFPYLYDFISMLTLHEYRKRARGEHLTLSKSYSLAKRFVEEIRQTGKKECMLQRKKSEDTWEN